MSTIHRACFALTLALGCGGRTPHAQHHDPHAAGPGRRAPPSAVAERAASAGHAHGDHDHAAPSPWSLAGLARGAVRLDGLGDHHRAVSTRSPEAQAFFDQGLRLTYGFNHDEAARSFARAAELDPGCAMCFWGAAYTLGPNYNFPMFPDRARAAWDAMQRAQSAAPRASPVEQALIAALARRYPGPELAEPSPLAPQAAAYADAMRAVARRFPDDLDVQALFAEALMNVRPWKLWSIDGTPAPGTDEIVRALEAVLARAPQHPGANHYYIHAVEASPRPQRAEPAAERLGALMPDAGHAVHMPAHIFQRVGRYAEASEANRRAIAADERYLATVTPPGYYRFYLGHNHGFLSYSASMEGRAEESIAAARAAAREIPRDVVCGMAGMDFFLAEPLLALVRFGRWREILAEPPPPARYPVLSALYRHARGMALASTGRAAEARADAAEIRRLAATLPESVLAGLNAGRQVLALAAQIVEARAAEQAREPEAIAAWEAAVAQEDALAYNEPADWFYPARHYLGAALLRAGRAAEAERVYRADLARNRENGWALFGLAQALRAQRRGPEAAAVDARFRRSFGRADVTLRASAF